MHTISSQGTRAPMHHHCTSMFHSDVLTSTGSHLSYTSIDCTHAPRSCTSHVLFGRVHISHPVTCALSPLVWFQRVCTQIGGTDARSVQSLLHCPLARKRDLVHHLVCSGSFIRVQTGSTPSGPPNPVQPCPVLPRAVGVLGVSVWTPSCRSGAHGHINVFAFMHVGAMHIRALVFSVAVASCNAGFATAVQRSARPERF